MKAANVESSMWARDMARALDQVATVQEMMGERSGNDLLIGRLCVLHPQIMAEVAVEVIEQTRGEG